MSQSLNLKIKGLFTSFNDLSEVPEGALAEADNIDILQDSVAQPRRGFDKVEGEYDTPTDRTDAILEFQDKILAHHGPLGSATTLSYLESDVWTGLGSISAPTGYKIKTAGSNQNLYLTSSTGVKKLEAYNSSLKIAGAYKGLNVEAALTGTSGFLADTKYVAYRVVWGYKDANENLILGAPSQRAIVQNNIGSSETRDVELTITIPDGVDTSWFVQVYRSEQSDISEPSDELKLVYETFPDSTDISNGYLLVTDITPDDLRGATIYTAASQEGIVNANEQPPLAHDIEIFRECLFYANTISKHRFTLTLISVDGTNGIQVDDTVTIGGVTYTGKGTEDVAAGEFKVFTSGGVASNITDTALSIVRTINGKSDSTVYAYYTSGPDDLPGRILLEERVAGGNAFAITSSRATCWNPADIPASGTSTMSSNDNFPNGLMWSKPNQPESVPLPNFVQIGSKNSKILRIISLREALYVFKDNGEIYRVSGYYPTFQVDKIEDSVRVIAPETCQVLNNQIYCLSDQGVVVVADSTKVISRPIEQNLLSLMSTLSSVVTTTAFGISYETDRKYYIFLPTFESDTAPTQAFVYNVFTNTWVRHTVASTCGLVTLSGSFYIAPPDRPSITKERKTYSYEDYVDYGFETSVTSVNGLEVKVDSRFADIEAGDVLIQGSETFAFIESKDPATQTLFLDGVSTLNTGDVTVYKAIKTRLTWVPTTMGNPGVQKQLHTATVMFKQAFPGVAYLGFSSDLFQDEERVPLTGVSLGLWGEFPWGDAPWGGTTYKRLLRQWVPRAKQRSTQLIVSFNHAWAFGDWQLIGLTLFGNVGSEKISR